MHKIYFVLFCRSNIPHNGSNLPEVAMVVPSLRSYRKKEKEKKRKLYV